MNSNEFKLPTAVVSQADINRAVREISGLDDFFLSAQARSAGTPITPPRITFMLEQVAKVNSYNLMESAHRGDLKTKLSGIINAAPILHISFATEPSPRITDTIVNWLRSNIHPHILVVIGLQPTIAAGCVVRTGNKIFDMSLRSHLQKQEPFMVKLIQGAVSAKR